MQAPIEGLTERSGEVFSLDILSHRILSHRMEGLTERSGEVFSLDILSHRMSALGGMGSGPGSLSSKKAPSVTATLGWVPATI
jgi:hypothetical protein